MIYRKLGPLAYKSQLFPTETGLTPTLKRHSSSPMIASKLPGISESTSSILLNSTVRNFLLRIRWSRKTNRCCPQSSWSSSPSVCALDQNFLGKSQPDPHHERSLPQTHHRRNQEITQQPSVRVRWCCLLPQIRWYSPHGGNLPIIRLDHPQRTGLLLGN